MTDRVKSKLEESFVNGRRVARGNKCQVGSDSISPDWLRKERDIFKPVTMSINFTPERSLFYSHRKGL